MNFKETFRGHGLGYDYLTVNHNDEDYGCLSLFSIDPSAPLRAQLKAALPDKKSLSEAIVVIAVDLARPWAVINSLQKWIKEISVSGIIFVKYLKNDHFTTSIGT